MNKSQNQNFFLLFSQPQYVPVQPRPQGASPSSKAREKRPGDEVGTS